MARLVALQNERLEHLFDILVQLVGDVLGTQVAFIDLIGDELILHLSSIEQTRCIRFSNFFHSFLSLFRKVT